MLFMPSIVISITSNRAGSLSLLIFGLVLSKILSNHELVALRRMMGVSLWIQRGVGFPFLGMDESGRIGEAGYLLPAFS